MRQINAPINLVICQKSKIKDWIDHFTENYDYEVYDLTKPKQLAAFMDDPHGVAIINYDLIWRRREIAQLSNFTLMLDESSLIQNQDVNGRISMSKRAKFICALHPSNVILLSGTPCGGKYEKLYTQIKLLGWNISYTTFYNSYVKYHTESNYGTGVNYRVIDGYKNVEHLKSKLAEYGAIFKKTDEVIDLPSQIDQVVKIERSPEYKKFDKMKVVTTDEYELVGDCTFAEIMGKRKLCGMYSEAKLQALKDLIDSTDDRLIIFYNFDIELEKICSVCKDKPISVINGKLKDLKAYTEQDNSITLVQYQAGAMGLNLQKANKIIYFTPTLSSDLFEQSKKRIHRINQDRPCFYYYLVCADTIEDRIYAALKKRRDYTNELFEMERI